jgi:hypothetical protein
MSRIRMYSKVSRCKKKIIFYYFYVMVDYIFDLYKYKDSWGKFVLSKFC